MPTMLQRSPDTDAVIEVLASCNGEITYRSLAERANLPLGRMKEVLNSARRILRNEQDKLFAVIRGEGLKLLDSKGRVHKSERTKKQVGKKVRKEIQDLEGANYADLNKADQNMASINRTVLNAIWGQARTKSVESPPKITRAPLPDSATLISMKR